VRCSSDRSLAAALLHEKTQLFEAHPIRLEGTEYAVKAAADLRAFAEFVAALEGRPPEIAGRNIDDLQALCSEFGFAELLLAMESFGEVPWHGGIPTIEHEPRRRVHDVEKKTLQLERNVGFLQQELAQLPGRMPRSDHAISRIFEVVGTARHQNQAPPPI
jgi:hypothetical protein